MYHLKFSLFLVFFLCTKLAWSQEKSMIKGRVTDKTDELLPFVNITLKNSTKGASTDKQGKFSIKGLEAGNYTIRVSLIGYRKKSKEIVLQQDETKTVHFQLKESSLQLHEVVVTSTMKETRVQDSPVKLKVLSESFLENDPTNNVIDAIENVNGVQQQLNCGVCGTNNIRINGMEGPYTLLLIDGMPIMSNLASVYGFDGIPTSLVEQIEVVKGPNSTLYGTEAMGGVINIRTKSSDEMPLLSLNTYYTTHNELNADVSFAPTISDNVATTFSGNFFHNNKRYDFNDDNFMDVVLNRRVSLFNKWSFKRSQDLDASIAARYYNEERTGGTMRFEPHMRGSDSIYGESIRTERFTVLGTYDIPLGAETIRADVSYNRHDQNSYYGTEEYIATQSTWFTNLTWRKQFASHQLLTGLTGRWELYEDNTPAASDYNQPLPGIFAQNQWQVIEPLTILGGLRLDYNDAHGSILSPRLNIKYEPSRWTTARLNFGTGFRQVHLFTEDHAALTGSREVAIREDLQPEKSYNLSLNLNHIYQIQNLGSGSLDFDLFYTYFTNKITPNYNISQDSIIYQNLDGYGMTRGASFSMNHNFSFPLKVQLGTTAQQAYEVEQADNGEMSRSVIEFTPVFSGNFAVSYDWKQPKMKITYTGRVMGPQKLPEIDEPFHKPQRSKWYTIQNVKISKDIIHQLAIYAGVKNLMNWTQPSPLIDPANPFGERFDTYYVYGPLQPRRFYVGVKWHLDRLNQDEH